jgi:hypothetical protein
MRTSEPSRVLGSGVRGRADVQGVVVRTITRQASKGMFREQAEYFAALHGPPDEVVLMELSARHGVYPVEVSTTR